MSLFYRRVARPILFTQDAETIHDFAMRCLGRVSKHEALCRAVEAFWGASELPIELFGLRFPNPVGLAAGMDKHADALPVWPALGFGFAELGAVTWHAQPGNPRPRVFRAISEEAIVNRMGFNNHGAAAMADQLAALRKTGRWPSHPVGINLGKSKVTPLEDAAADYASSLRALWPHADFFVVNVSSPNTPNLRQLQDKAALAQILAALQKVNLDCAREHSVNDPATAQIRQADPKGPRPKPILVKVAPDLSFEALDEILELVGPHQVAGLVATNTTITRPETRNPAVARAYAEAGGLSGKPLRARSTEVVRHLYSQTRGSVPIIGVGGIFSPDDAWEKIAAGACLVQVYTGFVYMGPGMVRKIVTGLRERLDARGLRHLEDAVGTGR